MKIVIICPYCHKKVGAYGARSASCPHCRLQVGVSEWEVAIKNKYLGIPLSPLNLSPETKTQLLREIFAKLPCQKGETPTVFPRFYNFDGSLLPYGLPIRALISSF
ncbi:hypothetical protein E3J85_02335 [Patescibacteria group bacterium]|nr:MAG: hypothetical protein E3J85_02335 [Patescibacteria group bacterium]